jgi:hypothetical protein
VTEAGDKAACEMCNWRHATELFQQLSALLEGDDYVPHELMTELKMALPCQSIQHHLKRIEKLVGEFNYAQARGVLSELDCVMGHNFQCMPS